MSPASFAPPPTANGTNSSSRADNAGLAARLTSLEARVNDIWQLLNRLIAGPLPAAPLASGQEASPYPAQILPAPEPGRGTLTRQRERYNERQMGDVRPEDLNDLTAPAGI